MNLTKEILEFLSLDDNSLYIYTHRTLENSIGDDIIENGFEYSNDFRSTTDEMMNDRVHVQYWMNHRDNYGDIVIVICIKRYLLDKYIKLTKPLNKCFEDAISEIPPYVNNDGDTIYLISKYYIKGYFNVITNEIVKNSNFNPSFDNSQYLENLKNI